jgi:hypothetical protein
MPPTLYCKYRCSAKTIMLLKAVELGMGKALDILEEQVAY